MSATDSSDAGVSLSMHGTLHKMPESDAPGTVRDYPSSPHPFHIGLSPEIRLSSSTDARSISELPR